MSHPFCVTAMPESAIWPRHGWLGWNGKAIHIRAVLDRSVSHPQAVGEAITRWNDAVGCRFLMVPDKGTNEVKIIERTSTEPPFSTYPLADGGVAAGYALNWSRDNVMLGTSPGQIYRSEVYLNRDIMDHSHYWVQVSYVAHEIGHAFGLADHPEGHPNSIMGYQADARRILGPTYEDELGIASIYALASLDVTPEMLDGIEGVESIWWHRRADPDSLNQMPEQRWRVWAPGLLDVTDLRRLTPLETYHVAAREDGLLGYGRFQIPIFQNVRNNLWMFA